MRKAKVSALVLALGLALTFPWSCASSPDAPRVDQQTLKSWLTDPQVVILDVRAAEDWQSADKKIKGAVRHDPKDVKTWAATLPKDKKIVLYCA
jgi:rhodanese-related sulfurtransferase